MTLKMHRLDLPSKLSRFMAKAYKRRIMDMGITKGSEIFIRKVAPLGDPVEVTIRGYELSLRKADAECVDVQTV